MKTIFTAIPRPAFLFALALFIGSNSLAKAGDPDDLGSFDDILVALDPAPLPSQGPTLNGPVLNGPTIITPSAPTAVQLETTPVPNNDLIINGPIETLPAMSDYPSVIESRSEVETQTAPKQIQNPFLDFETVVEAPIPKQIDQTQHALPYTEPAPRIVAPRKAAAPILVPATPLPSVAIRPQTAIIKKTVVTTTTYVPKSVKPECPYERAQRLQQQALYPEPGYRAVTRTGYIPYGGRGLDRDYDRYRPYPYKSRSAQYIPVYRGYPSGHRHHSRSGYYGGRSFSIGLRF